MFVCKNIQTIGAVGIATLAEALPDASSLALLDLERCGVIYSFVWVCVCVCLCVCMYGLIHTPFQAIGAVGLASLAEALPDSSPLAHLDLERCGGGGDNPI